MEEHRGGGRLRKPLHPRAGRTESAGSPGTCHVTAVLLRLLRALAAGAGVQEPPLLPGLPPPPLLLLSPLSLPLLRLQKQEKKMVSPFWFPVSSQWRWGGSDLGLSRTLGGAHIFSSSRAYNKHKLYIRHPPT